MKLVQLVFDCYIKSSIHVAIAIVSLTCLTSFALNIPNVDGAILGFIFCGTIVFYNFMKYSHLKFVFFESTFNKIIAIISLASLFTLVYFFLQLNSLLQIRFLLLGMVVFMYPICRKIKLMKMFFVAVTITYTTAYIPISINQFINFDSIFYIFLRFLWILCLLIPFEIRDFATDKNFIITVPHHFGIQKTKLAGYFFVLIIGISQFDWKIALLLFLTAVSIYLSSNRSSKYFASFWVESIPIFGLILYGINYL